MPCAKSHSKFRSSRPRAKVARSSALKKLRACDLIGSHSEAACAADDEPTALSGLLVTECRTAFPPDRDRARPRRCTSPVALPAEGDMRRLTDSVDASY